MAARIEGVPLPDNKRIEYGLTYVHGIGLKTSRDILTKLNLDFNKRVHALTDEDVTAIQREISSEYQVEGKKRREVAMSIRRLQEIKCYRGRRHAQGLPVRGQNTKNNARTRKGPKRLAVAKKKQAGKK
jgi:small subunit ribosomal protein S13